MIFGYVLTIECSKFIMTRPDTDVFSDSSDFILVSVCGFQLTTDLVVEIWCTRREVSEGLKISKCELSRRFVVAAISKTVFFCAGYVLYFILGFFYNSSSKQLHAVMGDIKYEHELPLV